MRESCLFLAVDSKVGRRGFSLRLSVFIMVEVDFTLEDFQAFCVFVCIRPDVVCNLDGGSSGFLVACISFLFGMVIVSLSLCFLNLFTFVFFIMICLFEYCLFFSWLYLSYLFNFIY